MISYSRRPGGFRAKFPTLLCIKELRRKSLIYSTQPLPSLSPFLCTTGILSENCAVPYKILPYASTYVYLFPARSQLLTYNNLVSSVSQCSGQSINLFAIFPKAIFSQQRMEHIYLYHRHQGRRTKIGQGGGRIILAKRARNFPPP